MDDDQKQNLLKQVRVLAKELAQPEAKENQNQAKQAKTMLTGMIAMLPKAAEAVTAVGNLLPVIANFLGLSE